jgi:hypothetical protein
MDRTQWLQDRRMQKFRDVLSRWERRHTTGPSRSVRPLPRLRRGCLAPVA